MKVLLTGSSGFVGSALVPALRARGHTVHRLVRRRENLKSDESFWNPETGEIDRTALNGVEGVIHLAGENVSAGRWTAAEKERLLSSRTKGTSLLAQAIVESEPRPAVMVSASAIGYYGSRGDTWLDESSPPGSDFLAEICKAWEQAAAPVAAAGVRLVLPRIGVVLNHEGGALKKMLLPFRLGLGGPVGDGRNYISWIARTDLVRALIHCLENPVLSGPVNLTAPNPATNAELTKSLAAVLHRPAFFPIPKSMLILIWGEMAKQTILSSMRTKADKLIHSGFNFTYQDLDAALRAEVS